MVSFNEMHGYYYEFQDTGTVYYCIIADQLLSCCFIVGWLCFFNLPPHMLAHPPTLKIFTYFDSFRFISFRVASDFCCFASMQNNRKHSFLVQSETQNALICPVLWGTNIRPFTYKKPFLQIWLCTWYRLTFLLHILKKVSWDAFVFSVMCQIVMASGPNAIFEFKLFDSVIFSWWIWR